MRSKRTNVKNHKFTWLRKLAAVLCSCLILCAALLIAFLDWTLDAANFENSSEINTADAIGEVAFLNLEDRRESLIDLDFALENTVVKSENLPLSDEWQHNLLILNMGDKESTSSSLLMAILSVNNYNKRKVLQFINPKIYANITGLGNNPIGQAWLIGGSSLLYDSIEKNLAVKLSNMFILDAAELVSLIDTINGVAIKIGDDDLERLAKSKDFYESLLNANNLNGKQQRILDIAKYETSGIADGLLAVAFAGLPINNSNKNLAAKDFAEQIVAEFDDLSAYEKVHFIRTFMKSVTTQSSKFDLLMLAKNLYQGEDELQCRQLPQTGTYKLISSGTNGIIDLSINEIRKQFKDNIGTDPVTPTVEQEK